MSAKRVSSISAPARRSLAAASAIAAGAALACSFAPREAVAQEFAYCDMAVQAQWKTKLQQNVDASVVFTGERRKQGIRLTEEKLDQRGTVFHSFPIAFKPGESLYTHFRVRISGGLLNSPPNGGEGFSFILANDPGGDPLKVGKLGTGIKALGAGGDGFGYKGITQSFALELDTLQDQSTGDPDGNHLAFDLGGLTNHTEDGSSGGKALSGMPEGSTVVPWQPLTLAASNSIESASTSYDTRDVWLDYECAGPGSCSLKVYMTFNNAIMQSGFADSALPAKLPTKPAAPIMEVDGLQDIASYMAGSVGFAGFSASTGTQVDEHLVTYWVVSHNPFNDNDGNNLEDVCDCGANGGCNGSIPICDSSTSLGFCRDCLSDAECAGASPTRPICNLIATGGTGACVECNADKDCPMEKKFCNAAIHECTPNCTDDTQCDALKWCDNPSGMPYGGMCTDDLSNGAPMPTSGNHTPALDGTCTAEAAAVVCASGVCDGKDNKCGLTVGQACAAATGAAQCRSGVCTGAGTCGCENDAECGEAVSGIICDDTTRLCHDGCRGAGGNTCPDGFECKKDGELLMTSELGECVKKPTIVPGPHTTVGGSVEGSGIFTCGLSAGQRSADPAAALFLAALAGRFMRRRSSSQRARKDQ